jgi:hypothetical protein
MNRETARLKTEVVDGKIKGCTIQSLNHDALYAHALVQAITGWTEAHAVGPSYVKARIAVSMICHRADELMREWSSK